MANKLTTASSSNLVTNSKALEIIQTKRQDIDTLVAEDTFFKAIASGDDYRRFKTSLINVEKYLNNTMDNEPPMNLEKSLEMATGVSDLSADDGRRGTS